MEATAPLGVKPVSPPNMKEVVAVYRLLEEALPLALNQLRQGGIESFEQWAFWTSLDYLDDVLGEAMVEGIVGNLRSGAQRGLDEVEAVRNRKEQLQELERRTQEER